MPLLTRFQIAGTPDAATRLTEVFKDRELVYQEDTNQLYIGDGTTAGGLFLVTVGGPIGNGANVGVGGVGVFKQIQAGVLEFKNINAGSTKITVTNDVTNDEVDIDVDPAQIQTSLLNNDAGFETPTELDARDTANRSRANHTGTQLASTISDFSATTLATILTGFVTNNSAVVATDSVLVAMGKLQGQIDALPLPPIETYAYQFFTNTVSFTNDDPTFISVYTFNTPSLAIGTYIVKWTWTYEHSGTGSNDLFRIAENTTELAPQVDLEEEGKDVGADIRSARTIVGELTVSAAGSKIITLRGAQDAGAGGTTVVKAGFCEVYKVG